MRTSYCLVSVSVLLVGALAFGNPLLPRRDRGLQPRSEALSGLETPARGVTPVAAVPSARLYGRVWSIVSRPTQSPLHALYSKRLVLPRDVDAGRQQPVMSQPANWTPPRERGNPFGSQPPQ